MATSWKAKSDQVIRHPKKKTFFQEKTLFWGGKQSLQRHTKRHEAMASALDVLA
jgi:hypothetical protein